VNAVQLGDALETGRRDDGEVAGEVVKLLRRGAKQQLMHEHVLAGQLIYHAHADAVLGVRARKAVEHKQLSVLQISAHAVVDVVELLDADGHVHLAPSDLIMDGRLVDDETVVGRAAGILAGGDDQRAGVAQLAFPARKRELGQPADGQVAIDSLGFNDAEVREIQTHGRFLLYNDGYGSGLPRHFNRAKTQFRPNSNNSRFTLFFLPYKKICLKFHNVDKNLIIKGLMCFLQNFLLFFN